MKFMKKFARNPFLFFFIAALFVFPQTTRPLDNHALTETVTTGSAPATGDAEKTANPGTQKVGEVYHGFLFEKTERSPRLKAVGKLFRHVKSGARVFKLETGATENFFSIAFRTLPDNHNGVAHVLEHCCFGGSRRFPVKSLLETIEKKSVNTYFSALTGKDRTYFPFATRNKEDFFNLMNVYLDMVFYPRVLQEPKIFEREAWNYQLEAPEKEITINGIVYNEMKGGLSDTMSLLNSRIVDHLFPGSPYGLEAGGRPEDIPNLTYEQLKAFHARYYHPANAYIFLEGNLDVLEQLKFMDKEFLSNLTKKEMNWKIPSAKPLTEKKKIQEYYPVDSRGKTYSKSYLTLSFRLDENENWDDHLCLPILRYCLSSEVGSFSVSGEHHKHISFILPLAKGKQQKQFKKIILKAIKKVVRKGFKEKTIASALNMVELDLRDNQSSSGPTGMNHLRTVLNRWMFKDDPFYDLDFEKKLKKTAGMIKNKKLEEMTRKIFLENPNVLSLTFCPQKGLLKEKEDRLKTKLAQYKSSLSPEKLRQMVEKTSALKRFQTIPDSPETTASMPGLSLEDVDLDASALKAEEHTVAGVKLLHYPADTAGLVHFRLYFDASVVPQKYIPYLRFMSDYFSGFDTHNSTPKKFGELMTTYTGGLYHELRNLRTPSAPGYRPVFIIKSRVLNRRVPQLMQLLEERLLRTRYLPTPTLIGYALYDNDRNKVTLKRSPLGLAVSRLKSYLSPAGMYDELTNGYSYYKFLDRTTDGLLTYSNEFSPSKEFAIVQKLQVISRLVFDKSRVVVGVCCSPKDFRIVKKVLPVLLKKLPAEYRERQNYTFDISPGNEAFGSATPVQYTAQGYNLSKLGFKYSGKTRVVKNILKNGYLTEKIRLIGGAYSLYNSFSRDGTFYMSSYRDPNLNKTLDVFDKAADYLENLELSPEELKGYIITSVKEVSSLHHALDYAEWAFENHFRGVTPEMFKAELKECLTITPADIKAYGAIIREAMEKDNICVYGNMDKLKENKTLFKKIVNLDRVK